MPDKSSLNVQVTSNVIIFPSIRKDEPISTPLSIFDNASANFARCAAVWFYGPPTDPESAITSSHLQASLSQTLNYYPHFCGRLSYAVLRPNSGHNERYQRIWVTYNNPSDIGVTYITATSFRTLSEFLPTSETRKSTMKAWNGHQIPSSQLLPTTKLAISSDKDAPNVIVQFTTFACGSTAVAIEITHCLADAVAMSQFAKDWARTSQAILGGHDLPALAPIFDPQRLDAFAEGDIDAKHPEVTIQTKARGLPQHRYDWYKPTKHQPWPPKQPEDFDVTVSLSPSDPIPWAQWDTTAPVSLRVFYFSPLEISHIYALATSSPSPYKISKHDALLAHIWSRINASRQLAAGSTTYLDMTFGLRPRITPPLPDSFLGSPITHAAIPSTIPSSTSDTTQSLALLASNIRATLSEFSPDAIAAILHDKAFEYSPTRLWSACLGREHLLLTTWIHSGVYDVDFVGGGRPVYVEALMPDCDGLVEVMEAPGIERCNQDGNWWDDGVDVSVYLETKAMERLLADEWLWIGK
jgi:hypothetical protein